MVLKFWLLNVQDKLLGFFSQAQAHPLPLSSPSFHLYILSISINNGSDDDGDGDDTGNRRGTHFLEKKSFFSSRIEFFVCFFGSILYYVDLCMIEYEMNRKFDRFLGFRRGTVEKWELKYKPRNARINREVVN